MNILIADDKIDLAIKELIEIHKATKEYHPAMKSIIKCLLYAEVELREQQRSK